MFSVIICSVTDAKFEASSACYRRLLAGRPHEVIRISDARGLCEGYNRGVAQSRGDAIILSHDDIEVLNPAFAERVEHHLRSFDLIGVAGTTRVCHPSWAKAGPPHVYGQIVQKRADRDTYLVYTWGAPQRSVGNIQALDGVFFACRRSLFDRVRFDPAYTGWHLYDIDFSYTAYRAGFRLGVATDLHLIHHERATHPDPTWRDMAGIFWGKYGHLMPPHVERKWVAQQVVVATKDDCIEAMTPPHWVRTPA